MKKRLIFLTTFLFISGMVVMANGAPVKTTINARIDRITGDQLPTTLLVGDIVTFVYSYDNESTTAHYYDFNGNEIDTVEMATYPQMTNFLSDANVTYSDNLLQAFSEYNGHTGYNETYDFVYMRDDGAVLVFQSLLQHVSVYQGSDGGSISNDGGHIILWTGTPTVTTVYIDWINVSTVETPEPTINSILLFFDESVSNGTLNGVGKNPWLANLRQYLMKEMLIIAKELIDQEKTDWACFTLKRASVRCDSDTPPPDFVQGESVSELYDMVLDLMAELGCE